MDTLHFDGSCDPNPGGRLGFGWVLDRADGSEESGRGERLPAPGNTNNVAEYMGLCAGLESYVAAGRRGPLKVVGDSQLIIGQMLGATATKNFALVQLRDHARGLARRIPGGVSYHWQRREHNTAADALAGDGTPSSLPPPHQRTYALGANVETAPVSATVRNAIMRLNAMPAPGFKDFTRLVVGGADSFSGRQLTNLVTYAGPAAVLAVRAAFPDNEQRQAAALRWCLRGLAIELAIRKGQIDAQLAERTKR